MAPRGTFFWAMVTAVQHIQVEPGLMHRGEQFDRYAYQAKTDLTRNYCFCWLTKQIPEFTTLESMVKNRGGKMYLGFLQNRPDATIFWNYNSKTLQEIGWFFLKTGAFVFGSGLTIQLLLSGCGRLLIFLQH
jgi:hypothetical protein